MRLPSRDCEQESDEEGIVPSTGRVEVPIPLAECRSMDEGKKRKVEQEFIDEDVELVRWRKERGELLQCWRDGWTEREEKWVALRRVVDRISRGARRSLRRDTDLRLCE